MKLYECEVKAHLQRRGASVPKGSVVRNASEAVRATREQRLPVMLKAQLLSGGRGRAGLVRRANTVEHVEREAAGLWQGSLHGEPVRYVLVEEALEAERELYLSISVSDREGVPILLAGAHGGVDVEERAAEEPAGFLRIAIDPVTGLRHYQGLPGPGGSGGL